MRTHKERELLTDSSTVFTDAMRMYAAAAAKSLQSCLTLCVPTDGITGQFCWPKSFDRQSA